jgi:hypothetical protein
VQVKYNKKGSIGLDVAKEGGHYRLGEAYISFLIQSGANLAQTLTKVQQN